MNKIAAKRIIRICSVCGNDISVEVDAKHAYRGGHYFGIVPQYPDAEIKQALKAGTRPATFGTHNVHILNHDPRSHGFFEYWECDECYRNN